MNVSQKRYFTILQMLEAMQADIKYLKTQMEEISESSADTNNIARILNARMLFAGQALLGKNVPGFKKEFEESFRYGITLPE